MDAVQSSIRQRSSVLAPALSSLVMAVFLGATGCFFTAFPTGLAFDFLVAATFAITFLTGAFLALVADAVRVDLSVVLALGILLKIFVWFVFCY